MKNNKRLLTIEDCHDDQLKKIVELAFEIKKSPSSYHGALIGKTLGLIFEKPSTRTRISFEVGMNQLGGSSFNITPGEIQPGKRESVKDIARTLSRYLDCLVLRTFSHDLIREFDEYAKVPVINGLSDLAHPCQALADYFTIYERWPDVRSIRVAYTGDSNNVLHSLLVLFSRMGMTFAVATPKDFSPKREIMQSVAVYSKKSGANITFTHDPVEAVTNADVVYTDVWVSMGEESLEKDLAVFQPFQVNSELLKHAKPDAQVMHCLPAYRGKEITDEVMESPQSIVFDQAENRLHLQKGVLLYLLTES